MEPEICVTSLSQSVGAKGIITDGPVLIENDVEPLLVLNPSQCVDIVIISPGFESGIEPLFHRLSKSRKNLALGRNIGLDIPYRESGKISANWETPTE